MGRIDAETETLIPMRTLRGGFFNDDVAHPLLAKANCSNAADLESFVVHAPPIAATLTRGAESSGKGGYAGRRQEDESNIVASFGAERWAVRRLMPIECERLQGFRDGYTLIPFRGKPASDGLRYKSLGNSMATNVMRWLGRRIDVARAL